MKENLRVETEIAIDAPASAVWKAVTDPAEIKQYFFGTDVHTDWKVGSPIEYTGVYNGVAYHDKGIIKQNIPEKILQSTYWSSMSGKEDKPENYQDITYELMPRNGGTTLKVTQLNVRSQKEQEHSTANWKMVLEALKKFVEGKKK